MVKMKNTYGYILVEKSGEVLTTCGGSMHLHSSESGAKEDLENYEDCKVIKVNITQYATSASRSKSKKK